uniref:conjugal transfer nickase/helicase domain-containing protein n=1 Tax=Neisseria sp. TaxID=192066 RepID=UPI00359F326C
IEPISIEPKSIEPKSIEPKSIEPKSIEPKSIEPKSIEPKSIDSIDEFLNQHNIFSEDDTDGSASEHDATSEPVPQMEQHPEKPVIAAKSVPAKKSKHAAKPITASKLGAKKLEELVTAGRDSDAAAISGSETTLPADQTETDAASRSEQDIQAVSPDADREDSDALPYEASSGAGLAEAWAELDSLPRRSPRSVTVHQPESVLNAPENPANDADGIQRLNEQRESLLADGRKFLNWLAGGLADGTISVNQSNSPVHVIDRGMLLVTPEIFRMYSLGYFDKNNPECPGVKAQKAFLALGMHERTKRTGIFSAKAEDKHLFTCFLIPEEKLHYIINTDRRPANNIDITIEESRFGKSLERKA